MTVWKIPATVVRIHDGDTFIADLDLGWHVTLTNQSIRLAGCNAPELATTAGKAALAYIETLLKEGDPVSITSHSLDKYGRVLADVTLADGRDLTATMIAANQAAPWNGEGMKPVPTA